MGRTRSRTSESVLAEARQIADLDYTEIQLLGQNVAILTLTSPAPQSRVPHLSRILRKVGFHEP